MHSKESGRETKGFDLMPLSTVPQNSCKMTKVQNQSLSTTLLPHLGQHSSRGSLGVTSPSPLGPSLKVFPQLDQSQLFLSTFTQFQICVSSFSTVVPTWLPLRRRFSQSLQQDSSSVHLHLQDSTYKSSPVLCTCMQYIGSTEKENVSTQSGFNKILPQLHIVIHLGIQMFFRGSKKNCQFFFVSDYFLLSKLDYALDERRRHRNN